MLGRSKHNIPENPNTFSPPHPSSRGQGGGGGLSGPSVHSPGPLPILDLRDKESGNDKNNIVRVRGQKCCCRRSWCPSCSKSYSLKTFAEHVSQWPWDQVRQVVLTIDPKKFDSPSHALQHVHDKKLIPSLMRNMERTQKRVILDWIWVLEWHRGGYPHWHLMILVGKRGKAGMLQGVKLRRYWRIGGATEKYFKSESHWKNFSGYFNKHGYFQKNKAHQSRLPDWARSLMRAPRRIGRKHKKQRDLSVNQVDPSIDPSGWLKDESRRQIYLRDHRYKLGELNIQDEYWEKEKAVQAFFDSLKPVQETQVLSDRIAAISGWMKNQDDPFTRDKTQGEALDLCGEGVQLFFGKGWDHPIGKLGLPYREFRNMPGDYVENEGYYMEVPLWFFETIMKTHSYEDHVRSLRSN